MAPMTRPALPSTYTTSGHATGCPSSKPRGRPRRRIYDLPHTAISHWLAAGLGSFEVTRFTGTSVLMVDLTYGQVVSGSQLDARRRLDERATSVPRHRAAQDE